MYAPYVVTHHPHITSLGYLHIQNSRIPSFVLPNLIPPDANPHSSIRMSEHRRVRRNQKSNVLKKRSIEYSRIREEVDDI